MEGTLILVNPPKSKRKVKSVARKRTTRKRTARKAARRPARKKATKRRTTSKAKRSAAAKKGWRTRKAKAAKRSAAAKKAARSRKSTRKTVRRKAAKRRAAPKKRRTTTKTKRAAAARKGWRTRKAKAAKRSRAAKKAARSRKSPKRKTTKRRATKRRYTKRGGVGKTVSGYYDTIKDNAMELGPYMMAAAGGVGLMAAYSVVKPYTWDYLGLTGDGGVAVGGGVKSMITNAIPGDMGADAGNLYEAALGLGTMAVVAAALVKWDVVGKKSANNMLGAAGLIVGFNQLAGLQTAGIGAYASDFADYETPSLAFSGTGFSGISLPALGSTSMTGNNLSQALLSQNSSAPSGAGFFGTPQKQLGATRVNLF